MDAFFCRRKIAIAVFAFPVASTDRQKNQVDHDRGDQRFPREGHQRGDIQNDKQDEWQR